MQSHLLILGLVAFPYCALGGLLPTITSQPQSVVIAPGSATTLSVTAANVTGYQWRFNGRDIAGATDATLQVGSADSTNAGYYLVVVKNDSGWVPSQMAYLSVAASSGGTVPFSDRSSVGGLAVAVYWWGFYGYGGQPITSGTAQVVAGPTLDQMQPTGASLPVVDGYFGSKTVTVPTVGPGDEVYYRVDISYSLWSETYTQQSTVLKLVAGGGAIPKPSVAALQFPYYAEWPEPWARRVPPANQTRVVGETFSLNIDCIGYNGATIQWRKDGKFITNPAAFDTNNLPLVSIDSILTITNAQPSDAGVYDAVILGNNWLVTPKVYVSIQTTNGQGVFRFPRSSGSFFISDLEGAPGRNYQIEWSTNLQNWVTSTTLSNTSGSVTFSNAANSGMPQFYRSVLLP